MDLEAIWLAIRTNLAPISVFSMWGVLTSLYRRFNKRYRFRNLRGDAREAAAGFARYLEYHGRIFHSTQADDRPLPVGPPEALDVLVEMLYQLQDRLSPLGVYLFRSDEISTAWVACWDRRMESGGVFAELKTERLREIGLALRKVSRLMNRGKLRDARKLFPEDYGGERVTNRDLIVGLRGQLLKERLAAHGHDPEA